MNTRTTLLIALIALFLSNLAYSQNSGVVTIVDSSDSYYNKPQKAVNNTTPTTTTYNNEYYYSAPDTAVLVGNFSNSVGVRYSSISGFGLSYSLKMFKRFSLVLTGMSLYSEYIRWEDDTKAKELENTKDIINDIGVELRGDVFDSRNTVVYALLGGHSSSFKTQSSLTNKNFETSYAVGLGVGFQWFLSKRVNVDLNLGYKFNYKEIDASDFSIERQTMIGFGAGIFYNF